MRFTIAFSAGVAGASWYHPHWMTASSRVYMVASR